MLGITDLHVAYGRARVLFGVGLTVPAGALVCLMGRNGVGKTTLLKAVTGVLPVRSGTITFDGRG
jgi:urea transport system ATP-binding protein